MFEPCLVVEKWLTYELLQLDLAKVPKGQCHLLGRIGYSPKRVRPISYFGFEFWGDYPLKLDATLGAKADMAVVVLGIGEVLNSGEKPSPIIFLVVSVLGQAGGSVPE